MTQQQGSRHLCCRERGCLAVGCLASGEMGREGVWGGDFQRAHMHTIQPSTINCLIRLSYNPLKTPYTHTWSYGWQWGSKGCTSRPAHCMQLAHNRHDFVNLITCDAAGKMHTHQRHYPQWKSQQPRTCPTTQPCFLAPSLH